MVWDAGTILALTLAVLYAVFLLWYGGRSRPLSEDEVRAFLDVMRRQGLDRDDPELFASLGTLLAQDDGREFLMLNLIRYRQKAAYPPGMDFGDSAVDADRRYGRAFLPWLLRYGNVPVLVARRSGSFIEPENAEPWQVTALVRYRSRRDLVRTAAAVAGRGVMVHKWAAVEATHVFPVRPVLSFIAVRTVVAMLFGVVALVAWNL
jgi:hypothetical protein